MEMQHVVEVEEMLEEEGRDVAELRSSLPRGGIWFSELGSPRLAWILATVSLEGSRTTGRTQFQMHCPVV